MAQRHLRWREWVQNIPPGGGRQARGRVSQVAIGALGLLALASAAWGCAAVSGTRGEPVRVVERVELERYLGRWYEIASFPIRAQRGCVGTTAEYTRREDGDIRVYNRCLAGDFSGRVRDIEGRAWVVDEVTGARLKVQFFWPFRGDYWVVELDPQYHWAVVAGPDRGNLWFLSRTPCMDQDLFETLFARMAARGFDMSRLVATLQQDAEGQGCQVRLPAVAPGRP